MDTNIENLKQKIWNNIIHNIAYLLCWPEFNPQILRKFEPEPLINRKSLVQRPNASGSPKLKSIKSSFIWHISLLHFHTVRLQGTPLPKYGAGYSGFEKYVLLMFVDWRQVRFTENNSIIEKIRLNSTF